jgi:hypothetical protein
MINTEAAYETADVGIDHGGGDIDMSEEFLDGANISSGFQQVGCEAVSERMAGDSFGDAVLIKAVFTAACKKSPFT